MFKINLRKINSLLIVLLILMLAHHALLSTLFFYNVIDYTPDLLVTGRRMFYIVVLHAVISLYLYLKDKFNKTTKYPKLIGETTQQIVSGIAIVAFVSLHIITYMIIPQYTHPEFHFRLIHVFIDIGLFISLAIHLRISIPRLLISFGFLTSRDSYTKAKRYVGIVLVIMLIIMSLAEIIYNVVIF